MMPFYTTAGFLMSGTLWITFGVSVLWWCKRIETHAALRLLTPVMWAFLICSGIVAYAYAMEWFVAHYSGAMYESQAVVFRMQGPYAWVYWLHFAVCFLPFAWLIPRCRRSMSCVATISGLAFLATMPPWLR